MLTLRPPGLAEEGLISGLFVLRESFEAKKLIIRTTTFPESGTRQDRGLFRTAAVWKGPRHKLRSRRRGPGMVRGIKRFFHI